MGRGSLLLSVAVVLSLSFLLYACYDEKDYDFDKLASVEWDPSYAISLLHGDLKIEDLLGELDVLELRTYDDSLYYLYYESESESDALQELVVLDDVNLATKTYTYTGPNLSGTLSSDVTLVDESFNVDLNNALVNLDSIFYDIVSFSGGVDMDFSGEIEIRFGFPTFSARNTSNIDETITVSGPGASTFDFNFQEVLADLTQVDPAPDNYNKFPVRFVVTVKSGTPVTVNDGDEIRLNFNLSSQDFGYVKGYIKPQLKEVTDEDIDIELFSNKFADADVSLRGTRMDFIITHPVGVPLRIYFDSLYARNENGDTMNLKVIPNSPIDIDYPTTFGETADDTISVTNAAEIFDFEPVSFRYNVDAYANEDDDQSQKHFLIDTSKARLKFIAEIPLWGSASGLTLRDTAEVDLADINDEGNEIEADSAILKTRIENGYPLEAVVQAYVLDENYVLLDSLLTSEQTNIVKGAITNDTGIETPGVFESEIRIGKSKMDNLLDASHIYLIARLRTTQLTDGSMPPMKFFSNASISINMGLRTDLNVKVKP